MKKIKLGKCYVKGHGDAEVIEVGKRKSLVRVKYVHTVLGLPLSGVARYKIKNSDINQ
jgi:hypothetical protein|tara:strand:- start:204 stop:377 length:174 start_codon:yes stop_codon:yes gene_type:complete